MAYDVIQAVIKEIRNKILSISNNTSGHLTNMSVINKTFRISQLTTCNIVTTIMGSINAIVSKSQKTNPQRWMSYIKGVSMVLQIAYRNVSFYWPIKNTMSMVEAEKKMIHFVWGWNLAYLKQPGGLQMYNHTTS